MVKFCEVYTYFFKLEIFIWNLHSQFKNTHVCNRFYSIIIIIIIISIKDEGSASTVWLK